MKLAIFLALASLTLHAAPYYKESVTSLAEFEAMSAPGVGIVKGGGRAMKFFIDNRGMTPKVYFINGNFKEGGKVPDYVHYHYDFAMKTLGLSMELDDFNRAAYFTRDEKKFIAGIIHSYDTRIVFQLYPQDLGHDDQLATAAQVISRELRIPGMQFGFLRTGIQQKGYPGLEVPELLRQTSYRAIETGEAVGYLRYHPSAPLATDIAILEKSTDTLPPVAGVVVEGEARVNSALTLRLVERGRPVVEIRDLLTKWIDRPVRLKARAAGYEITAATDAEVAAAAAVTTKAPVWVDARELVAYDEMCPGKPSDCLAKRPALGVRGANGGFLRAALRANTLDGFAFSSAWYRDFDGTVPASWLNEWRAALGVGNEYELKVSGHTADIGDWRFTPVRAVVDANERGDELCRPAVHALPLGCAVKLLFAQVAAARVDRLANGVPPDTAVAFVAEKAKPAGTTLSYYTRLPRIDDVYGYFWSVEGEEGVATFARDWEPEGFSLLSRGARAYVTPANGRPALLLAKAVERAYCAADPTYSPGSDCRLQLVGPKPKALWVEMNVDARGGLTVVGLRELPPIRLGE